jgi:dolichol-phosphate mannosyltransferase
MSPNVPDVTIRRQPPFLSVVLSFYNESVVIPELVNRLRTVLRAERDAGRISDYELVFVNDASTDSSYEILVGEYERGRDLVIVNMSNNFGVSECVRAGMRCSKGDAVVYMDADLQDPPELIPQLLDKWLGDPTVDVVYTTRLSRAGENPIKLLITKYGYRFVNAISEIHLPSDSGDFKLLSRRVVEHLLRLQEKKPYIRGLVSWIGFKQVPVHYHRLERHDGRHATKRKALSIKVINYALDSAIISFSDAPLKAALFVGFGTSVTALIYIFVVIAQKILGWYVPGWPALMAAILFMGGVQLFTLGVIGLYVNIIFRNSQGRPDYIIESIVSNDDRAAVVGVPPANPISPLRGSAPLGSVSKS